ncbi:acetyl-CoA carboxylase biotin carboxyl carrier protein subunit [Pseudoalteromonas sp. B193]
MATKPKNINTFTQQREQAFAEEMEQWKRTGQLNYKFEESETEQGEQIKLAPGQYLMEATAAGSVWKINAEQNQAVDANESMVILESMKMEIDLTTSESAKVVQVLVKEGQQVHAGQALMILQG